MLLRRLPNRIMGSVPLMGGGQTYAQKALGYNPIAYWPLWEPSGGVAYDISGNGFHGAYTGVTLGQPGIGDERTCPLFDGAGDFVNVFSPDFRDAFNGAEGTAMIWGKVFNAGVWTDSTSRYLHHLYVDADNVIWFRRETTNNRITARYEAASVVEAENIAAGPDVTFFHLAMTWSYAEDEVIHFLNGSQDGPTKTGLGIWAGALSSTRTMIGASRTTGADPFYGYLAHCINFGSALAPAAIADLATV